MSQRRFKTKRRTHIADGPMAAPAGTRMRVLEQWTTFAQAMNLHTAGQVQRQEMRRAFYAGCEAFYRVVMTATDATTLDATESDLDVMADIHNELAAFALDVKEGRA